MNQPFFIFLFDHGCAPDHLSRMGCGRSRVQPVNTSPERSSIQERHENTERSIPLSSQGVPKKKTQHSVQPTDSIANIEQPTVQDRERSVPEHPSVEPPKKKKQDAARATDSIANIEEQSMVQDRDRSVPVYPSVQPPKKKKQDAVPSPESFAEIDKHALETPKSACSSVSSLANYLVRPTRNEMEKLRVVYRWVTDNIRYDLDGFLHESAGPQNAEGVLKSGTAVCAGYADLFDALCSEIGIICKKVSGFSKGYSYDPEKVITINTETDHAWNIVFINDEWRPVDSTWGAGAINTGKFEKCFQEFYFLTDPEDFVLDHFPYENKNLEASLPLQLLKKPVSLETFNKAICPSTKGIEWGFETESHKSQVITMSRECQITFRTKKIKLNEISCHFIEHNSRKDFNRNVLLRRKGDIFSAKVTPASVGRYKLRIFGKPVGDSGTTLYCLITFIVRVQSVLPDVQPYPDLTGIWGASLTATDYGFGKDIFDIDVITAKNGEVELKIRNDSNVKVILKLASPESSNSDLKRYTFEYYSGNNLIIKVRCPLKGFYKLTLFAQNPKTESNEYDHVADFLIESKNNAEKALPYPDTYPAAQKYGCVLSEPLIGELPANREVRLKLRSETLFRLMVNDTVHKKGQNGFDFTFKTPAVGERVVIYGSAREIGQLDGLYTFDIVRLSGYK